MKILTIETPMKISFSGAEDESLLIPITINIEKLMKHKCGNVTIDNLLNFIYENYPTTRRSFYKTDGTLANGTICLIDEQDIEVRENDELCETSNVVLITTLHGG